MNGSTDHGPVDRHRFDRAMSALVTHPTPTIAVAVSGGPDSLALALLTAEWAARNGSRVIGITVDHRIRKESRWEAAWVGQVLATQGIRHRVATWTNGPEHPDQADARDARYQLLQDVCEEEGADHLALAHHRDDQAETVLLRSQGGSGSDGMAGMPAARYLGGVRLIRPVLDADKDELKATLTARGLNWVEDPSNTDRSYARVRVREALPMLERRGLSAQQLFDMAATMGRARAMMERERNALLRECVSIHEEGYAVLDTRAMQGVRPGLVHRALSRIVTTTAGRRELPRSDRLEPVAEAVHRGLGQTRTIAGCQLVPKKDRVVVIPEWEQVQAVPLEPGTRNRIDGRFTAFLTTDAPHGLTAKPIGRDGWRTLTAENRRLKKSSIPGPARFGLIGIFQNDRLIHVPALPDASPEPAPWLVTFRFEPERPLIAEPFEPFPVNGNLPVPEPRKPEPTTDHDNCETVDTIAATP